MCDSVQQKLGHTNPLEPQSIFGRDTFYISFNNSEHNYLFNTWKTQYFLAKWPGFNLTALVVSKIVFDWKLSYIKRDLSGKIFGWNFPIIKLKYEHIIDLSIICFLNSNFSKPIYVMISHKMQQTSP